MKKIKDREAMRAVRIEKRRKEKLNRLMRVGASPPEKQTIKVITLGCRKCGRSFRPDDNMCDCGNDYKWVIQEREYVRAG